jgi:hypothetical protein
MEQRLEQMPGLALGFVRLGTQPFFRFGDVEAGLSFV